MVGVLRVSWDRGFLNFAECEITGHRFQYYQLSQLYYAFAAAAATENVDRESSGSVLASPGSSHFQKLFPHAAPRIMRVSRRRESGETARNPLETIFFQQVSVISIFYI
jgi:hypothetical protein